MPEMAIEPLQLFLPLPLKPSSYMPRLCGQLSTHHLLLWWLVWPSGLECSTWKSPASISNKGHCGFWSFPSLLGKIFVWDKNCVVAVFLIGNVQA